MRSSQHDRRWLPGQVLVLLVCLCLTGYFAYHAKFGRYGFEARSQLVSHRTLLDFEIKSLEANRQRLKHDVTLLSDHTPHPDIIDEIARVDLGFAGPTEFVIFD